MTVIFNMQMRAWLDQADERITEMGQARIAADERMSQRLTQLRSEVDARLVKEMERIEFNSASSMGEMVSAGIEEIGASSKASGELCPHVGL